MKVQKTLKHCKNCTSELNGKYCSNCGQAYELKRINKEYILNEIGSVLNFEKGIFYTIRELSIRPGKTIREFILEDRNRLVKPIIFIIISALIYSILRQIFHFEDGYVNFDSSKNTSVMYFIEWIRNNYGYANILIGIFIAFWVKIFFRKYEYNFYELLILICFVMGIGLLIYSVLGVIEGLTKLKVSQFSGMVGVGYFTWAIGQFFDEKKYINYLIAFFSYLLGMITFVIAVVSLVLLIDLMI